MPRLLVVGAPSSGLIAGHFRVPAGSKFHVDNILLMRPNYAPIGVLWVA